MKIELGIKKNNNFIALPGKGGCSRLWPSKLQGCVQEEVLASSLELSGAEAERCTLRPLAELCLSFRYCCWKASQML